MAEIQQIVPNLWFNDDAEAAAAFYCRLFGGRELRRITYPLGSPGPEGAAMIVEFEILGMRLTAINGFADREYTDAVSLSVTCEDQAELDRYWDGILEGGGTPQMCGWINDRWGLRWQIVPRGFLDVVKGDDAAARKRAFAAMLTMIKLDGPALEAAARGE